LHPLGAQGLDVAGVHSEAAGFHDVTSLATTTNRQKVPDAIEWEVTMSGSAPAAAGKAGLRTPKKHISY
jgi:hypothetical protein